MQGSKGEVWALETRKGENCAKTTTRRAVFRDKLEQMASLNSNTYKATKAEQAMVSSAKMPKLVIISMIVHMKYGYLSGIN